MSTCIICRNPGSLKCAACNRHDVYYCGKACQTADWRRHKYLCKKNDFFVRRAFVEKPDHAMYMSIIGDGKDEEIFRGFYKQSVVKENDPDQYKKKFNKMMKLEKLSKDMWLFLFSDAMFGSISLQCLKKMGSRLDEKDEKWMTVLSELVAKYEVSEDDYSGDGVQEKMAVSKGLLLRSGVLIQPFLELRITDVCEVCGRPAQAKCSVCESVYYCGKECQRKGWASHKTECPNY